MISQVLASLGQLVKTFVSVIISLFRCTIKITNKVWSSCRTLLGQKSGKNVLETCPRIDTVMLSLLILLTFLALVVVALVIPTSRVKWIALAVSSLLVSTLAGVFAYDIHQHKTGKTKGKYSRNLANTVFTVLFTIIVLTTMYIFLWQKRLNEVIIQEDTDTVQSPRFPAFAFFQRWENSQANITAGELKCWTGPYDDGLPLCSSFPVGEVPYSCDCGDNWPSVESSERGLNKITWLNQTTTYYPMIPKDNTISKGAGHFMTIQVFFTYNQTESKNNQSLTTAPGIWMAIYDPSYQIHEIGIDDVHTAQIDANSHTVVNIGLQYYEYLNRRPVYIYGVAISVRQNLDLVCDPDDTYWWLCHLTVEVQIPSTVRTIIREERRYHWSQVVADAGAYFALVQFFSWIVSGAAWAAEP